MLRPSGKSMKPALQSWQSRKLRQAPRVGGLQSHLEKGRFTDEIASDYGSLRSPAGYSVFGAGFGCAVRRLRQERHDLRPDEDPDLYERVQSPDCGKYGMICAESATTASAAPAATSTRLTTGRSVATRVSTRGERLRVGARRASEVRTAAAFPAATAPVAA